MEPVPIMQGFRFPSQGRPEAPGVALDLNILKGVGELIAAAPAVAVNAAVGAAPVDIHAIIAVPSGQRGLGVHFCA